MSKETDLIKQKVDIVDFIRSYVNLTPAGKNFKALCPFHQEKTPSFIVSPDRHRWHCFGSCGEGGDVIKFLMKYENLEFPEALRVLAEKAGIEIEKTNPREYKEFGVIYAVNEEAKDFYKKNLEKNKDALDYLKERGISIDTIRDFDLGFAPSDGEALVLHLVKKGLEMDDIVRAGLAVKVRGMYLDRFRSRIIFPIFSLTGRVVAFTGRVFGEEKKEEPKYINSPETPVFNKSKILYGLNMTKNHIAEKRSAFIVEGQTDLLMAWQIGLKNVVAASGTGFTKEHLDRLRRLADEVVISFDNDEAGLNALERAMNILSSYDFYVRAVDLGRFKDPAEAAQEDPEFLKKALSKANSAFTLLAERSFKGNDMDTSQKKRMVRGFLRKIMNVKSSVEEEERINELAKFSGVSENALRGEIQRLREEEGEREEENYESLDEIDISTKMEKIVNRLVALAYTKEEFLEELKKEINLLPESHRQTLEDPRGEMAEVLDLHSSFLISSKDPELLKKEFSELLIRVKIESIKGKQKFLREKIRRHQSEEEDDKSTQAASDFYALAKEIEELKNKLSKITL